VTKIVTRICLLNSRILAIIRFQNIQQLSESTKTAANFQKFLSRLTYRVNHAKGAEKSTAQTAVLLI
jgi:hypothetical protein